MVNFEVDTFARQAIGFDRLFDVMNNIRGSDVNYPPYDIIKEDEEIDIPIQGGLDPKVLLTNTENVKKHALKYLNTFKDQPYIFNLGHGVLPETSPEMVDYLVKMVKDY